MTADNTSADNSSANNQDSTQQQAQSTVPPTRPATEAVDAAFTESTKETKVDDTEKLRIEVREANDRALRAVAELENYRKRVRREMEDERRYAALPVMRDILNVMDNLQRAIESAEKNNATNGLLEGVKMVAIQLETYLEQHNCKRIAAVGTNFDPNFHEAIAQEASTEHASGIVTRVARHGFQLHDRVIRPAQVMVSTGNPAS